MAAKARARKTATSKTKTSARKAARKAATRKKGASKAVKQAATKAARTVQAAGAGKRRGATRAATKRHYGTATSAGYVPAAIEAGDIRDYVVAELRYEAPVAVAANAFAAPAAEAPRADALNELLAKFSIDVIRPQFSPAASSVSTRMAVAATLPEAPEPAKFARMDASFVQSGFVQVVPKPGEDAKKIAAALSAEKGSIWNAYVAPRPVPAMPAGADPGSRNFEPSQGYLYDAPDGIGAEAVWSLDGARGQDVTICDI